MSRFGGKLARAALGVSAWTMLSRILGFIRDRLFFASFGGSLLLDCFLAAFQLPNLLRNLFGEGALSSALLPRYVRIQQNDPAEAKRFAGVVVTRTSLLLFAIALVGMIAAVIVMHSATGRPAIIARFALPMIPFLITACISALYAAVLNAHKRFWVPAAAPVVLNLCLLVTVGTSPEHEARWLPWAVLAGGVLTLVMHLIAIARLTGIPPWQVAIPESLSERIRDLRQAFVPSVIASGFTQLSAFIDTQIALILLSGNGPVQILYFANRLMQLPMAIIGHGISTVAFTTMSERAAQGGFPALAEPLRHALTTLIAPMSAAALGLLLVADPTVRAIYQSGSGNEELVRRVIFCTQCYAAALLPLSLGKPLSRAFHAAGDVRTPLRITLVSVLINVAAGIGLCMTPLREAGIAIASICSGCVMASLFFILLARRDCTQLIAWNQLVRPGLALIAMSGAVLAVLWLTRDWSGTGGWRAWARVSSASAVGGALWWIVAGKTWRAR